MIRTHSAKLYPTPEQERSLARFLNVSRWVYNRALEHRKKAWDRRRERVSYYQQQSLLVLWRSRMEWLRDVPSEIERDGLRRVERGMKAFLSRLKSGGKPGFPRFKSKQRWHSFEVMQCRKPLHPNNYVFVPGIGHVKYRGLVDFQSGAVKGIRVVRKESGWYLQLIVDIKNTPTPRDGNRHIGIDLGLSSFATLSNGRKINNPRWRQSVSVKIKKLSRIVSRRKHGSHRRLAACSRLARFHERVAETRRDWIHKTTRSLVGQYDLIAVENLNVQGMVRSSFAKGISDAAWSQFVAVLTYKAENAGAKVVAVDARNTSQNCSECGQAVPKTIGVRVHSCTCGYVADRDENAARNILRRATAEYTRGETWLHEGRSLNREEAQKCASLQEPRG
jgi:putative transposase